MRRILLISLVLLVILPLVTAGVVFLLLHNESFLKSQVHSIVLKQTGRALHVDGPLRLNLGRETRLLAEKIRFQNAIWGEPAEMVEIGRLEARLIIPSLWQDTVIVPTVALEDCRIILQKNESGEANWDVLPAAEKPAAPRPQRTGLPVLLLDLSIRNCRLDSVGTDRNKALAVEIDEIGLQMDEASRARGEGSGRLNGEGFSFAGWISSLEAFTTGGKLEHELRLDYGETSLESGGTLENAADLKGADIEARLLGPDIGRVLSNFELPPLSEGPFDFNVRLDSKGQMTALDVDGDLGSLEIRATGAIDRLAQPQFGEVDLAVNGPDLEAVGAVLGAKGLVPEPFSIQGELVFDGGIVRAQPLVVKTREDLLEVSGVLGPAPVFANSDIAVQLVSNELGRWRGRVGLPQTMVGPVAVSGRMFSDAAGQFSVDAQVRRLGGASIDISGSIGDFQGVLEPDLQIDAHSTDLQPLGRILGVENLPATPASARGGVRVSGQTVHLNAVEIDLSGHRIVANGGVNLAENFAGSRLDLEFDSPNVAELGQLFGESGLPAQPLSLKLTLEPEENGLAFQAQDGDMGDIQIDVEGTLADMQRPQDVTARFDVHLPSLSMLDFLAPGRDLPDLPFSANGNVDNHAEATRLDRVLVTVGRHSASVDGYLNHAQNQAGSRLNIALDIADLAELGNLLGQAGLPPKPLKLDIGLEPQAKGLAFHVKDSNQGDVQLDIEGSIEDMAQPLSINARFDVGLPSLSMLDFLAPGRTLPDLPLAVNGALQNDQKVTRLDRVRLKLGRLDGGIEGTITTDERFDLALRVSGPDASVFSDLAGQPLPPEPFALDTSLAGDFTQFDVRNFSASLGTSLVAADLQIALGDTKKVSGKIESPRLDLGWLKPQEEPAEEEEVRPRDWVFDDTPVMQISDHGVLVDLDLNVAVLDLGNTVFKDIGLGLLLSPISFELKPFSLRGASGGAISGEATLDNRTGVPRLQLDMQAKQLRLGLLSLEEQDAATIPPTDIELHLDGSGMTQREMASSLGGTFRLYTGSGIIAEAGVGLIFGDFITELLNALNPFAEDTGETELDCSVAAADIESGQVTVSPVILHTRQVTVLSEGTINLNTEDLDLSFNTKARKGLGLSASMIVNPFIKVGGRLASPAVELDPKQAAVSGGLAVATVGVSLLAKSMSDRFLSSKDPCGDARKEIEKRDQGGS